MRLLKKRVFGLPQLASILVAQETNSEKVTVSLLVAHALGLASSSLLKGFQRAAHGDE